MNLSTRSNSRSSPTRTSLLVSTITAASVLASGSAIAQSETAQSAMIASDMPPGFVILGSETWAFDSNAARDFYTNQYDGNPPTIFCSGQGCMTAPNPGVTSGCLGIPDPQTGKRAEQAIADKCNFFVGDPLTGSSYTRVRNCNFSSGTHRGNWRFTYRYLVNPVGTGEVGPRTAWDLINTTGFDNVPVEVTALIAGQSVLNNEGRGRRSWTRKYSFTLAGSDGGTRVNDLQVDLSGDAAGTVFPGHVLDTNPIATDPENANFLYVGNAGENPLLSPLLVPAGTVANILQGFAPARDGRVDDFAGNDGVVGQVDFAHMDPVVFDLGPGDYTVTISGLIKGVGASVDAGFGVDLVLDIDAEGCTP